VLGERHDVKELLAALDAFVLASHTEGIPMTVLEAMAACLPVVCTDVGGLPQVILDGETGILVPPHAPSELARAMLQMIHSPDKARQMGLAGRRRVEEHFDLRKVVARYEELYTSLVSKKRGRRMGARAS
jgi:glycosyltransferase involved in cell wall biosynthesis